MKISLYEEGKLAFNPNTEKNIGVGGTQSIIVNVGRGLAKKGHEVVVYVKCNFPDIYDGVKYYQYYDYQPQNEDLLIGFESLPKNAVARQIFNWSTRIAIDDVLKYPDVDKILVLSQWHRDRYASDLPKELMDKIEIVEPGVIPEFFQNTPKWPLSIGYAGHPIKGGMEALIETARRLKPKLKDSQIHVYGSGRLWGWDDSQYRPLYDNLIRNKILYHGQAGIDKMIKHLNGCQIFLYPVGKHHQETFCLVILQAMAAGCVVIASDNGNIKNLVKDAGFIIPGSVEDYKWHLEAIDKIFKIFDSPSLFKELSDKAQKYAKEYTWEKTVNRIEELCQAK